MVAVTFYVHLRQQATAAVGDAISIAPLGGWTPNQSKCEVNGSGLMACGQRPAHHQNVQLGP